MKPIRLSFRLNRNDFIKALRAHDLSKTHTRLTLVGFGLGVALVGCGLASELLSSTSIGSNRLLFEIGIIVFAFLYVIYRVFLLHILMARRVNKEVLEQTDFRYEIGDDYFNASNAQADSKMSWDFFDKAKETKEFYILTFKLNKGQFTFIPKRAFESLQQETAFRTIVESHLGQIK